MTDENMNYADADTQQQEEMIPASILKNRLAQKDRIHQKQMDELNSRISELESRSSQNVGNQAAQNVVQGTQAAYQQPYQSPSMEPQQPNFDPEAYLNTAIDVVEQRQAQREAQKAQAAQKAQQEQEQNEMVNRIGQSAQEDPEFADLLRKHGSQLTTDHLEGLKGYPNYEAVLKQALSNDDIKNELLSAQSPRSQVSALNKAAALYYGNQGAQSSKQPASRMSGSRAASTSPDFESLTDPDDLRRAYKEAGLY